MNNNEILKKLRIAFSMKDTDVKKTLELSDMFLSQTEINAFFRKSSQRNYVACGDQVLRRFLDGIIERERKGK